MATQKERITIPQDTVVTVTDWATLYEVNRDGRAWAPGQELRARLDFVRWYAYGPKGDGLVYNEIADYVDEAHGEGAFIVAYGLFAKLLEIAAKQKRDCRGRILGRGNRPLSLVRLARITRFTKEQVTQGLTILLDPEVAWLTLEPWPGATGACDGEPRRSGDDIATASDEADEDKDASAADFEANSRCGSRSFADNRENKAEIPQDKVATSDTSQSVPWGTTSRCGSLKSAPNETETEQTTKQTTKPKRLAANADDADSGDLSSSSLSGSVSVQPTVECERIYQTLCLHLHVSPNVSPNVGGKQAASDRTTIFNIAKAIIDGEKGQPAKATSEAIAKAKSQGNSPGVKNPRAAFVAWFKIWAGVE